MPANARIAARALALAALIAALTTGAAYAGCGGVQRAAPSHWHKPYLPPLAIGGSTMLLALPNLVDEGFSVNAHGYRQFPEVLALLAGPSHAHQLPHLVVIALGADGSVTQSAIQQTLAILGNERMLVLVTPRELGGGSGSDAATARDEGRLTPTASRYSTGSTTAPASPAGFNPTACT